MRLRHKKWTNSVLQENEDIILKKEDIAEIKSADLLEIGSGKGRFLLSLAEINKDKKLLGVEININAFASSVKNASQRKEELKNFSFINETIDKILPLLDDESIENIYINFPDPWPKNRQKHRRLTYPSYLKEYYRVLKKNGKIYFRTDNSSLFEDSLDYFQSVRLFDLKIITPFLYENSSLPCTEYECKFRSMGIDINLLVAEKR